MSKGADSGPIIASRLFRIEADDDAASYYHKSSDIAARLLVQFYDRIVSGTAPRRPQDESMATYLLKRGPQDSHLDFTGTARQAVNLVRAVRGVYPPAFFFVRGLHFTVEQAHEGDARLVSGRAGQVAFVAADRMSVVTADMLVVLSAVAGHDGARVEDLRSMFRTGEMLNE
jgi:methionyl-tRNA formyltransferase